jgi:Ca2+-binding RTX toxin-like protein
LYIFLTCHQCLITIEHIGGTYADGKDTLDGIEWGAFKGEQIPLGNARLASEPAPRIIPLPLEDGELETKSVKAVDTTPSPNTNDLPTPPYVSLTAPVAMLDGNVDFTLNISPYKPNIEYNIAYIFDTSASMDSGELLKAKNAYTDLTNYFINSGLAENINFGVVKFSRYATLYENLTAEQAISTIQGLTSSPAIEGTKYNDALYQGMNFLSQSPIKGATNIAYFVSDGRSQTNFADPNDVSYVYDAQNLRRVSNVQAFGIYDSTDPGGVTSSQINFVDSNNGVLVNNINDLSTELNKSGLAGKVSQVNILVDDVVVDTIQASELTDGPLGLTYEGSVEDLDVSANAKNVITAEVVFNDNTATTAVDYTVTAGQGKLTDSSGNPIDESGNTSGDEDPFERMRNGGDSNDEITIGYADKGASGGAGADYIVGNKRDNTLDGGVGNDTIKGHRGNDTIITGAGTNKVDGGDGIDTAVYGDVVYQGNTSISLRQAADTVSYNNTDTLTDVEYIQFSDVRISAKTLQVTPILQGNEVNLTEAKTGTTTAQFTFNLSTPAPVDVVFNYNTVDGDAVAGQDYLAKTGQVIISAGNTSVTVEVEIIGDNQYNESTETFALNLSSITGATFANNETEYTVAANIQNRPEDLNLVGDAGQNTLTGGQGNDTLDGKENNDYLSGEAGNDSLIGGTGLDTLVGGSGNDIMTGDTGNDTYVVDVTGDTITETSTTATEIDTVQSSVTYSLGANLENLTLTGTGVTNGSGNTLSNTITGNTANNTLIGNTGNDTVIGGLGDDLITGGYGSDFLIGEGGNDTMAGGVANDTYVVDTTGDSVEETSTITTEIDTVQAGITYTLGSNLEKLTLTGTSAINATGNTLNNTLTGNAANNTLVGGAGIDTMAGGTGNDTYVVDNTGDVVSENSTLATEIDTVQSNHSHTLSANVENLTLTGIYGTGGSGNSLNNNLTGNSGNNSLWGGAGIDTMAGGTGNDTYFVDNTRDVVSETSTLATEIDTVQSNHSHALSANVENLILTGTYGTGGSGNSLNNTITGNAANNTLAGGTGSDIMAGGTGNDTYVVDNTGDVVSETSTLGTEIDTVQSGISHTLSANVENLTLTSSYGIGGYGNSLNNNMTGNIANNVLVGNEGNDTLNGSDGDDQLYGKVGSDLLLGGQGNDYFSGLDGLDTIYGDQGNDSINGGNDRDVLFGGTENDTLIGGVSNDTMTGGADSDRFIYDTNAAFTTNALGIDQITDFVNGTDKIVLDKTTFTTLGSVVGGGFSLASEFAVVGSDSAAATADAMIVYSSESDNLFYNQNGVTAGLGSGAQFATLSGISGLNGDDFVLQA